MPCTCHVHTIKLWRDNEKKWSSEIKEQSVKSWTNHPSVCVCVCVCVRARARMQDQESRKEFYKELVTGVR
jgi:hypothetical protein